MPNACTRRPGHPTSGSFLPPRPPRARTKWVPCGVAIPLFLVVMISPTDSELGHVYAAWLAIRYEEGLIACSQDGMPHSHSIEQLVASMAWDPSRVLRPAARYVPPVR